MALLTHKSMVDYGAQQSKLGAILIYDQETADCNYTGAFEDFLTTYESTTPDLDAAATDALEGLNIDEDGLSDDYIMVDGDGNGRGARQKPGQYEDPKKKYMNILQRVIDRKHSEVKIELDDLKSVRLSLQSPPKRLVNQLVCSMSRVSQRITNFDW